MGKRLQIPESKLHELPLSIDTNPFAKHAQRNANSSGQPFRLGFMARIAPEKGLHHLVDAFLDLAHQDIHHDLTLHVAGWLGEQHQDYLDEQIHKIRSAGLTDRFVHHGSPTLDEKVDFLSTLDLLCVPTDYHDPKGLFVLEAMAAGVPVLQPDHGAFGELIQATGGGITYPSGDHESLVDKIAELKSDQDQRQRLAETGRSNVLENHTIESTASRLSELLLSSKS